MVYQFFFKITKLKQCRNHKKKGDYTKKLNHPQNDLTLYQTTNF